MTSNRPPVNVPDVENGDEADLDDIQRPYARLKSSKFPVHESAEFEVLLDEREDSDYDAVKPDLAANFFYDDKLFTALSGGCNKNSNNSCDESDEELEPFERLARNMEDLTADGGVRKKIVKEGVGASLTAGTTVWFHYRCYLEYGDEPIDSTHLRGKTTKAKLGNGDVLQCLDIAVSSMRLKETARFLVQPNYAFGKQGCPPRIPGNATLFYDVSLESAVDCAAADEHEAQEWGWEKHNTASFDERYQAAQAYHRKGNSYYSSSNLKKARRCYQQGVWLMEHAALADEQEETSSFTLQAKLFSNMAKVSLEQQEPTRACTQCRMALELPFAIPIEIKAKILYRYGTAKALLNSFGDARKYFLQTQKLKPNCPAVAKHLQELTISERKYRAQERFMCKKMFAAGDASLAADAGSRSGVNASAAVTHVPDAMDTTVNRETAKVKVPKSNGLLNDDVKTKERRMTVDSGVVISEIDFVDEQEQVWKEIDGQENLMQVVETGLSECNINEVQSSTEDQEMWFNGKRNSISVKKNAELNKLPGNLKMEFIDIVLRELDKLVGPTSTRKEVLFPCNLSTDEVAFLSSTASDYGCYLDFVQQGSFRYPKVVKAK
uniref:peptidylprolyl isomerase n=2 Tax=Hirondellea gigas TaxID=1518452 RepID=A0A2P2I7B5_9CRUS